MGTLYLCGIVVLAPTPYLPLSEEDADPALQLKTRLPVLIIVTLVNVTPGRGLYFDSGRRHVVLAHLFENIERPAPQKYLRLSHLNADCQQIDLIARARLVSGRFVNNCSHFLRDGVDQRYDRFDLAGRLRGFLHLPQTEGAVPRDELGVIVPLGIADAANTHGLNNAGATQLLNDHERVEVIWDEKPVGLETPHVVGRRHIDLCTELLELLREMPAHGYGLLLPSTRRLGRLGIRDLTDDRRQFLDK